MGVGVVSDKFMGAIEVITSSTVEAKNFRTGETQKQQVWNSTIANLSLMALGSSAPEILLAVVETLNTLGKPPQSGLGPATIVGSASFNLLVISAVCIIAVKPGGHRTIDDVPVFVVTASSSVFAYVWMYFVLRVASPNVIEMWEALLTLLMFPTLLIVAYGLDSRWPLMVRMIRCFTCGKVSRVDAEDKVEVVKSLTIKDIFQKKGDAKVSPSEGGEGGDEEDRVELIGRQVSKGHDQAHLVGTSGMGSGGFGILTDGRKKKEKSKSRKRVEMEEKVAAILKKHQALGGGELDPAQLSALVQVRVQLFRLPVYFVCSFGFSFRRFVSFLSLRAARTCGVGAAIAHGEPFECDQNVDRAACDARAAEQGGEGGDEGPRRARGEGGEARHRFDVGYEGAQRAERHKSQRSGHVEPRGQRPGVQREDNVAPQVDAPSDAVVVAQSGAQGEARELAEAADAETLREARHLDRRCRGARGERGGEREGLRVEGHRLSDGSGDAGRERQRGVELHGDARRGAVLNVRIQDRCLQGGRRDWLACPPATDEGRQEGR